MGQFRRRTEQTGSPDRIKEIGRRINRAGIDGLMGYGGW